MKTQCNCANIHLIGPADLPSFECLAPTAFGSLRDSANVALFLSLDFSKLEFESTQLKTRRTPCIDTCIIYTKMKLHKYRPPIISLFGDMIFGVMTFFINFVQLIN
jgi:hypothetical protein